MVDLILYGVNVWVGYGIEDGVDFVGVDVCY